MQKSSLFPTDVILSNTDPLAATFSLDNSLNGNELYFFFYFNPNQLLANEVHYKKESHTGD